MQEKHRNRYVSVSHTYKKETYTERTSVVSEHQRSCSLKVFIVLFTLEKHYRLQKAEIELAQVTIVIEKVSLDNESASRVANCQFSYTLSSML